MKSVVIFLLFATVALRATAAPAEEAPVQKVELKEEPKPAAAEVLAPEEVKDEPKLVKQLLPPLAPELHSQYCLTGWEFFRGNCYYVNRNYCSWSEAVDYCARFGGTLASVHSPLEYNHLQYMVGRAGFFSAWIGGFHFESSWRWHDGSYFDYYNFASGGSGTTYKCVTMNSQAGQGWFSSPCSDAVPAVCQIKVHC